MDGFVCSVILYDCKFVQQAKESKEEREATKRLVSVLLCFLDLVHYLQCKQNRH